MKPGNIISRVATPLPTTGTNWPLITHASHAIQEQTKNLGSYPISQGRQQPMPAAVREPSQTPHNGSICGHFFAPSCQPGDFMALQNSTKPFNSSKITGSATISELGAAVGIWLLNIPWKHFWVWSHTLNFSFLKFSFPRKLNLIAVTGD